MVNYIPFDFFGPDAQRCVQYNGKAYHEVNDIKFKEHYEMFLEIMKKTLLIFPEFLIFGYEMSSYQNREIVNLPNAPKQEDTDAVVEREMESDIQLLRIIIKRNTKKFFGLLWYVPHFKFSIGYGFFLLYKFGLLNKNSN